VGIVPFEELEMDFFFLSMRLEEKVPLREV
jgi:hypothetical protein